MGREIKFRGWFQGINGIEEWVYGYLVKQTNGNWEIINGETSWTVDNVGQYTGLKDKNGKEIYEGDVYKQESFEKVRLTDNHKTKEYGYRIGQIIYENGSFKHTIEKQLNSYFGTLPVTRDIYVVDGIAEHIEVIGNIYEKLKI
jgi:uncharacterized phage protein (TIGR01671 family)